MNVVPVASSSKGNAYVVEQGGEALLVDCGVSCRCLKARLDLTRLRGILITHNHADHVSGLRRLLNCVDVPVFANAMTAEAVVCQEHVDERAFVCFENAQPFEIGPFSVLPFSIPHDAADPVGYLIRGDQAYFHGTDIGTPLDSIGVRLAEADLATVESNHDPVLLRASQRPPSLKQRIAGPRGHLSNDQACALVRKFASPRLRRLWLAHLSGECNAPHLALGTMRGALAEIGRTDIEVEVAG
ncbi:MAG: MBL fold metallo-hydrolase [Kiritimatiellia bacterium]